MRRPLCDRRDLGPRAQPRLRLRSRRLRQMIRGLAAVDKQEHIAQLPRHQLLKIKLRRFASYSGVSAYPVTFIEGRDIPFVGLVDDYLYTGVASRDLPGQLGAVISRGVVDDEHSHVDTLLVIQHAADDVLKEMTVFVTRNNDAN